VPRAVSGVDDLRVAALRGLAPGLLALTLAACEEDVGEVAVRVASGYTIPSLTVGPDQFFASDGERFRAKEDGSPTIFREPAGPMRLRYERGGELVTACSFSVTKDRVVTVTLRAVGRELKCEIMK
jgi:hypothetical protein